MRKKEEKTFLEQRSTKQDFSQLSSTPLDSTQKTFILEVPVPHPIL